MTFKKLLALGSSALLVAALFTTGISSAAFADDAAPTLTATPTATQTNYTCVAGSIVDGTLDLSNGKYTWTVTFVEGIPGRYTPGKAYTSNHGHYTSSDYSNYSGSIIVKAKAKSSYTFEGISSDAVLNGEGTVATWMFTYTKPNCVVPIPASGTLAATATCNADGSATITWTLTNDYHRLMWVTWSANNYVPRDATTRTSPHSSKTFTQQVAAPAGGKTIREKIKLAWMDGSSLTGVTASVTIASDCVIPPPPVCAGSDFDSQQMWEVTWGYDFEHRNGGAPVFTMQSNGGLTQLNGGAVPSYMNSTWHWLYVSMGAADRVWTYEFADGTVRTATITGADCTPTIVWATIAPPPAIITAASASYSDHTCSSLGEVTLTGDHVTWTIVNDNATAAGPGGTVITGVPSAVYPALMDGVSPMSSTNKPYYGTVTVTAVAGSGYELAAPYSEQFTSLKPADCNLPQGQSMMDLSTDEGEGSSPAGPVGTPPALGTGNSAPPTGSSNAAPAERSTEFASVDLTTESAPTAGSDDAAPSASVGTETPGLGLAFFTGGGWLWFLLFLILVLVITRILQQRHARRMS